LDFAALQNQATSALQKGHQRAEKIQWPNQ
jgi:hypothetical protein